MDKLYSLLNQIQDSELKNRICEELNQISSKQKFGLIYENHMPEIISMPGYPITVGTKVAFRSGQLNDFYIVDSIEGEQLYCSKNSTKSKRIECSINDVIAVAEYNDPIFPYLKPVDSISNNIESNLWHMLIEADNYPALQLLTYIYKGSVDCIYIDPPYNTGARDWKYNNNYVDNNDNYKHSKWLSFMERRLRLAKELLNPDESVLIVTIDEKEYHHLGCLLEQVFPTAKIQMICSVINPHGANRKNMFARVEEYIYYVFIGNASVVHGFNDMLHPATEKKARWCGLMRQGSSGRRTARPNQFYPIFFSKTTGKFVSVGKSLPIDMKKEDVHVPDGCFAEFPINSNGEEAIWGLLPESFMEKYNKGYVKFGPWKEGSQYRSISHLQDGMINAISKGFIEVLGKDDDGALITGKAFKTTRPLTVWNQSSHSASEYGSTLLNKYFSELRFSFPKSLYAVADALRFVVANKKDALILDFFAGSGTTLHAVNLLNAEDGGCRRCIMVTNNEVSEKEARILKKDGQLPGDPKWEQLGIAHYVNWPRTVCSIKGVDVMGNPLKGNYIGLNMPMSDGFKSNAVFFKLSFIDYSSITNESRRNDFYPFLWMQAGAYGKCPTYNAGSKMSILPQNKMAVIFDESLFSEFKEAVNNNDQIKTAFIFTDSYETFEKMAAQLKTSRNIQLFRDYRDFFTSRQ